MGKESKIQWTEATWNPWHGCTKVSPGCKFCYMYRDKERYKQDPTTVLRSKSNFNAPIAWKNPQMIFTCSWSDFFIEEADAWRDEAWAIIKATPQHTYQILTKRPERIRECLPKDWGDAYSHVWLGVSAENQEMADLRIPILRKIAAQVLFVSFEPLLGEIHPKPSWFKFEPNFGVDADFPIEWIILGGESGNENGPYGYRPCEIPWITDLMNVARDNGCAVFVKQLGTYQAKKRGFSDRHGGNPDEWAPFLRVQEFPETMEATP